MECLETFLRKYNSPEETAHESLGFFHVSNEEIKEYNLDEEPLQELHPDDLPE